MFFLISSVMEIRFVQMQGCYSYNMSWDTTLTSLTLKDNTYYKHLFPYYTVLGLEIFELYIHMKFCAQFGKCSQKCSEGSAIAMWLT